MLLTPVGVKILSSTADSSLKELTIEGISGTLLSGLHIDKISWDDGDSISLRNVDLDLQYYNASRGRLVAQKVAAERLTINLANTGEKSGDINSLPDFGLPLNMNAHLIQLDSLQITQNLPDDPDTRTLLFQVKNIQLQKVTISDGYLRFRKLLGSPIILDEPLKINVTEGKLNMNQPHDLKTGGSISYLHPEFGEIKGNIKLAGTLTNYRFEGEVNHAHKDSGKQTINFLGQGNYKRVHLEKVKLNSPYGEVEAKGRLLWEPELRWAFLVDGKNLTTKNVLPEWPVTAETQFRYGGSYIDKHLETDINILSLKGKLREYDLKVEGRLNHRRGALNTENIVVDLGDNHLTLSGIASEPFNLKWDIDAQKIEQILPDSLKDLNIAGSVEGNGRFKGTLKKPTIKLNLTAKKLRYKELNLGNEPLKISGEVALKQGAKPTDIPDITLKNLSLSSGENTFKASGQANEPFDLKWNINANNLKQLSPQLAGQIKGNGLFKGSIKKPELKVKLKADKLVFQDFKQGKHSLLVEGDVSVDTQSGAIQVKQLNAKTGENTLEATGQASEPLKLNIKVDAQDLSQVSPDLAGRIQGTGQLFGDYKSPIIKTELITSKLRYKETRLAQSELKVKGEVQLVDGIPMIKELTSQIGNNRVQISGRASSPFDLTWNIDSKNLKQLMPDLSGQISAKGRLQGDINQPIINATGDDKNLRYQDFILDSADFNAKTNNGQYDIQGNLRKLEAKGQKVSKAKLSLVGRIENHRIKVSFDHQEAKVSLNANGSWKGQKWLGSLQKLTIKETKAGNWHMQKPTQLSISENSFSSSQLCLANKGLANKRTSICSTTDWSALKGVNAKGSLRKTPLAILKPWLPEDLDLNGTVSGTYDIQQNNGKPKGSIKFKLPNSNFSFKDAEGDEKTLAYKDAELTATINDRTVKAKLGMSIVSRGKLSANATIKLSPKNGKHTIKGDAQFDVPNINWAQEFIPHSRGLQGQFQSKLTFSGLLNKPKIVGKASLKNAYLRLPEAGTELTNININLRADKSGQATLNGKMFMGKGALNVTGKLDIRDIKKWKASVKINGNNIRFMNTNEIRATMSPDINVDITAKTVDITGKILIPQADINLKDIPEISIDENSDAYVVGERKAGEQVSAVRVRPNVLIQLGDKVRINAFDLRARLSGNVRVTHNRKDIITTGSLRVTDGKYQAYGQNLEINNGRLIFNGSPKLIGMDIRATRKIDDAVVGVHLGGTLLSPKSKIFSDPTLPESEALSYLITGHSLSSASGKESALLMSAVRGLGITGNNSLIHNIGASLGLDDVNIVTDQDFKKSKLQLGKRLGSRLYVRYLVGLFDQAQKVTVEYKINKVLSLEAEASTENYGLDFIYEIDRD